MTSSRALELCRAPACADDANVNAVFFAVDGVIDRFDRVFRRAVTAASEKLERHDLDVPVDTGDALAVVALGTDDACTMCSVAVVVHRVAEIISYVKTMNIVNVAELVIDIFRNTCRAASRYLLVRSTWL